jgi:hypothetical protein
VVKDLGRGDIIIISGNALDFQKNVGMMAGSVSGGNPGITVSGMLSEEAEGSTVMVVEGLDKEVKKILKIVKEIKGVGISRQKESLKECKRGNLSCKEHLACIYLRGV